MGPRTERLKHALYVGRVARRGGLLRVLRELGVWGSRPATREGAVEFRRALEELGTTYIKLGQLLSSRPDLLPDAYIEELGKLVDDYDELVVPQVIRPYVTEKVLVLERIDGRKVDSGHGLAADRAHELARQFFSAYVRQVTVEGVYHADPHRGNVLLTTDGRLALVDFGLLGRLDDDGRRNLALLLLAIAQNRA